jgi:cytochrome c peroxidase
MHLVRVVATVSALVVGAVACTSPKVSGDSTRRWSGDAVAEQVRRSAIGDVASLDTALLELENRAPSMRRSEAALDSTRRAFITARDRWKHVEWLLEAYTPTAADQLNGPPLPEVEYSEGHQPVRPPEGFQLVEALLWPGVPDGEVLAGEVVMMRASVERVRQILSANVLLDGTVWDAGRLELARIATLGLGGFDSPVLQRQLIEARRALNGVRAGIAAYDSVAVQRAPASWSALMQAFSRADSALAADADPQSADYWGVLVDALLPLARQYADAQRALRFVAPAERRAWRVGAATPFDRNALDVMFYAGPASVPGSARLEALGEALAHSTELSADRSRSCVSCHAPDRAYTDGLPVRAALVRKAGGSARNTPTLLNVALQPGLFADQRVVYLEDQVTDVVDNRAELHGDLRDAADRFGRVPAIRRRFAAAFGAVGDSVVTPSRIRQAIAAWERSLIRLESRFDHGVRGDATAIAPEEKRGFAVFMGKGRCGSCHFAPLFGGAVPPLYQKTEFEVLGTPATAVWRGASVDPDPGRGGITRAPLHRYAFKTPMLRNVSVTAPYMHNGVYRSLDEVIEFYARGGGHGIGASLEQQTLPPERIALSKRERRQLIAFLSTLTDTTAIRRRPNDPLPAISAGLASNAPSPPVAPAARATAARREFRRPTAR